MREPVILIVSGLGIALLALVMGISDNKSRQGLTCKPGLVLVKNYHGKPVCVPGQPPETTP